jgi:cyanophycinase-like exopeptidase
VTSGPIGLVGSGEFTPATEAVDLALLEGRPRKVVFLPTAAAPEGPTTIQYWTQLGSNHYRRLGIDATALRVLNRDDAERPDLAEQLSTAGLIYLSGGDPTYLANTLVGSRVGAALIAVWKRGAAVAGCSAGALALMDLVPDIRSRGANPSPGLGLVHNLFVMPHFDQLETWSPGATQWALDTLPPGPRLIGIEEDTGIVGGPTKWRVIGRQHAWLLRRDGSRAAFASGETLTLVD